MRPLYPNQVRIADQRRVISGIAKFLLKYGYWGHPHELAMLLECDKTALMFYLNELEAVGLVEKAYRASARSFYVLTQKGWQAVGLVPIEPWIARPRKLLGRIAHKVSINLADLERAERLAAQKWQAENGEATEDVDG